MPVGERDPPDPAQAAEPGDPVHETDVQIRIRQLPPERPANARGRFTAGLRHSLEFVPECLGVLQAVNGHFVERVMVLGKDERLRSGRQGLLIPREDGGGSPLGLEGQVVVLDREDDAGREAHEIIGVGQGPDFIVVVHAPHQAPLEISPGPEILHVEVTDGEHQRRIEQLGTSHGPPLGPAEERRAEEGKGGLGHRGVLAPEVEAPERELGTQPALVAGVRFDERLGFGRPPGHQVPGARYPTCFFAAASTSSGVMSRVVRSWAAPLPFTARLRAMAVA